jgi:hypothetical protein
VTLTDIVRIYEGSDGEATRALYERLAQLGPRGEVALNLFRAHKNSARAKVYRGGIRGQGSYRRMAYDRKQWAMGNLVKILSEHAAACGISWGWGTDEVQEFHRAVLYVDIPTGQVSFHTAHRGAGADYAGKWDGSRYEAAGRICRWIAELFS